MTDEVQTEINHVVREIEKTFWLRFFIKCAIAGATGFLATLVVLPVLVILYASVYGYMSRPPAAQIVVKASLKQTLGCMGNKPAKVVSKTYEDHAFSSSQSIITLQRGTDPTFICKFNDDALLYRNWEVNEIVYHAGGERL